MTDKYVGVLWIGKQINFPLYEKRKELSLFWELAENRDESPKDFLPSLKDVLKRLRNIDLATRKFWNYGKT